jgi:hypothetical protein
MNDFEQLAALKKQRWLPWTCSWYPSKPATDKSIAYIENKLKIRIPHDFIELSRIADNYGVCFGSIGEDYQSHNHLLQLNEAFHNPEIQAEDSCTVLPVHWVLINHGHDGACDCFDISAMDANGEYLIYHLNVECPKEPKLLARSFRQYLNDYA